MQVSAGKRAARTLAQHHLRPQVVQFWILHTVPLPVTFPMEEVTTLQVPSLGVQRRH